MRQIEANMNQAIRSLLSGGSTNWASSNTMKPAKTRIMAISQYFYMVTLLLP